MLTGRDGGDRQGTLCGRRLPNRTQFVSGKQTDTHGERKTAAGAAAASANKCSHDESTTKSPLNKFSPDEISPDVDEH